LVFASLLGLAGAPRNAPRLRGGALASAALAASCALLALAAGWRALGTRALAQATARGEPQLRLAALDRVVAAHPYLPEAWRERAAIWWALSGRPGGPIASRLERAEQDVRRALGLRPRWAEAWTDLGWLLQARGDRSGAAEAFARAGALDPSHPHVGLARAAFLAATEGQAAAIEALRALRQANPQLGLGYVLPVARRLTSDRALLLRLTDGSEAERALVEQGRE
ncbi:MAG TPA: hypothetical protein VF310_17405, partial [Vicinamibacteria bacterium]